MIRFRVDQLDAGPDPEDWERLGLFVERGDDSSALLVASALLPPDVAREFRRQMVLLKDVLDVEEVAG